MIETLVTNCFPSQFQETNKQTEKRSKKGESYFKNISISIGKINELKCKALLQLHVTLQLKLKECNTAHSPLDS